MPTYFQSLKTGAQNTVTATYSFTSKGFFKTNSTWGSSGYVHMKTNIVNDTYGDFTIEAVGYNYGLASDVFNLWGLDTGKYRGYMDIGSGLDIGSTCESGVYNSEDGYRVIYAYSESFYYCGFALNAYVTEASIGNIEITAISYNGTCGVYY